MNPSRKIHIIVAAFALLVIALLLLQKSPDSEPSTTSDSALTPSSGITSSDPASAPSQTLDQASSLGNSTSVPEAAATRNPSPSSSGPEKTRVTRRDAVVSDGIRRTVIDPMASWTDSPAWPEGPRLFAEVDTASRRYVNLRPDNVGELPRVRAEAEERIELRVNFPDGEPGEKIFVEIPNGGAFPDSETRGRVFELPGNRTLTFPYITDDSAGHCNVKLRHRGHTRSLPIWVGELPASDS